MLPRRSDTYLVGHSSMDSQHKELLDYAASLARAHSPETQLLCANDLFNLMSAHFAHEEALMRSIKYVDFDEHQQQHRQMLSRLCAIQHEIAGRQLNLDMIDTEVHDLLVTHIINSDRDLSAQISALEYWGCEADE